MRLKIKTLFLVFVVFFFCTGIAGGEVIKGTSSPDRTPEWYAMQWLTHSEYSPEFQVLDTESALGRYAPMTKTITLKDIVKFHGHGCDGLVQAASALKLAFGEIFPNGVVDRTELRILSKNSPCFMDTAAYLTGGRINFGTLEVDNSLGAGFIVQNTSTGKTVKVSRRPGVFPEKLAQLEEKVKSGKATPAEITKTRDLAWEFAKELLSRPSKDSFEVKILDNFTFPDSAYEHVGERSDIKHKNEPR